MKRILHGLGAGVVAGALLVAPAAAQQLTIGVTLAATGPGASLGVQYRAVYTNMPNEIDGHKVRIVLLDDATDPTTAVRNARRLVSEERADVIFGSTFTPGCLAVADVAAETRTPQLCLAPVVVSPDKHPWVFSVPQPVEVMIGGLVEHMKAQGVKTAAYIGFADGWGDLVWRAMESLTKEAGIEVVAHERYNRPDTSVTGQILRMLAARPDAVLVGASGTPAALPHVTLKERGFAGTIYQTHGVIGPDFIRVGGRQVEGAIAPAGPLTVAEQLPDDNPIKRVALDFFARFEKDYPGVRNAFAGYAYDAVLLVAAALPSALDKAKPGTPEFRQALRDALENVRDVVGTHAVYNMSPDDHDGVDERGRVLVQVKDGEFRILQP